MEYIRELEPDLGSLSYTFQTILQKVSSNQMKVGREGDTERERVSRTMDGTALDEIPL